MSDHEGPVISIHAVIPASRVNGPGSRMVVFFQGCERGCPGCFNPGTHPTETGNLLSVQEIFSRYYSPGIEGLTVSGGEPFLQPSGLARLLKTAKEDYNLTTVVYSGFLLDALRKTPEYGPCLEFIDVLIDGPFEEGKKEQTLLARGSTNQKFHFLTSRYSLSDFVMPGKVEVAIWPDGTITETGFSRIETKK